MTRLFKMSLIALGFAAGCGAVDATEADIDSVEGELARKAPSAAACARRTGGAFITFDHGNGDKQTAWITNSQFIDQAKAHLANGTFQVPVFAKLYDGRDCDRQWSWRVDEKLVSFADFTIEVCDAVPSYIQDNKAAWLKQPNQYCPWGGRVAAVDDRR